MNRGFCVRCLQPQLTCYCHLVKCFDPKIQFVILTHWREARKRIATGRLSHLCLQNSSLISGYDYSEDERVNQILHDQRNHSIILYPDNNSTNLSTLSVSEKKTLFPKDLRLTIFVIDGTWITARKTIQRSKNLQSIPKICFDPSHPSRFRVRKQPKENFFSTVEAIHETIEQLGESQGFPTGERSHDILLRLFDNLVDQQIELSKKPKLYCYWKPKIKLHQKFN